MLNFIRDFGKICELRFLKQHIYSMKSVRGSTCTFLMNWYQPKISETKLLSIRKGILVSAMPEKIADTFSSKVSEN